MAEPVQQVFDKLSAAVKETGAEALPPKPEQSRRLAERFGLTDVIAETASMDEIAWALERRGKDSRERLHIEMLHLLREERFTPGRTLRELAAIRGMTLFITMTP